MQVDIDEIRRKRCRESFYQFLKEFWSEVIPDAPTYNWHLKYICDELQAVAERVIRGEKKKYDLVINISPGTTKSTVCSRMFTPWLWARMPHAVVISGSHTAALSNEFSVESRDIIRSAKYRRLFPEVELKDDQDTKQLYENTKKGKRKAVSTRGKVTGSHGHFILMDDPIDPEGAISEAKLKQVNRWLSGTLLSRAKKADVTPFILIMQRLHESDPSAEMIERGKQGVPVKHICLPATITPNIKPRKLRRFYKNGLMDPVRLSKDTLQDKEYKLGNFMYTGQYLQDPVPLEGGMFETDKIVYEHKAPTRWQAIYRSWDKAGSTTNQSAYTAGVLMGLDLHGHFWILDVVRGRWISSKRNTQMVATAKMDTPETRIVIEQEPGSGGKESAETSVRLLAGRSVTVVLPKGDKALRADPLSVQVNYGNVRVLKDRDWVRDYITEMKHFPNSKFKDQIDATSQAFAELYKHKLTLGAL